MHTDENAALVVAADVSYFGWLDPLPRGVRVEWFESGDEALEAVSRAEVLVLGPDRGWPIGPVVSVAPGLRWVHTRAAGVDRGQLQPMSLFRERGITVTNGSGISSVPIAEYVAMAMLAVAKGLPILLGQKNRREWVKPASAREVAGTRALLVGFGDVGRAVWQRLAAFGVAATAVRRRPEPEVGIEVVGPADWQSRLAEFDWVIVTTPLTIDTQHLIAAAELAAMKRDAWLVNVSRGGVVDHAALVSALRDEAIGGAFLDVTDPEPLPASDELWSLPNAIVTPHCSWVSPSFIERASQLFIDNLSSWCAGTPLRNIVDAEAGY